MGRVSFGEANILSDHQQVKNLNYGDTPLLCSPSFVVIISYNWDLLLECSLLKKHCK